MTLAEEEEEEGGGGTFLLSLFAHINFIAIELFLLLFEHKEVMFGKKFSIFSQGDGWVLAGDLNI